MGTDLLTDDDGNPNNFNKKRIHLNERGNEMTNIIKDVTDYDDFKKVFSVFKEEPFFENWTEEEMHNEFLELKTNGEVFGYYLDDDNIVGIITFKFGAFNNHPVSFNDPENVVYFSDVAVLKDHRKKGYAKALTDFALDYIQTFGCYKEAYLRTNYQGSMSKGIMEARGFNVIKDEEGNIITQDITFERTGNHPTSDKRLFLSKRLG